MKITLWSVTITTDTGKLSFLALSEDMAKRWAAEFARDIGLTGDDWYTLTHEDDLSIPEAIRLIAENYEQLMHAIAVRDPDGAKLVRQIAEQIADKLRDLDD